MVSLALGILAFIIGTAVGVTLAIFVHTPLVPTVITWYFLCALSYVVLAIVREKFFGAGHKEEPCR